MKAFSALALTLLLLFIVSSLSENALPGDMLYPIKSEFNRNIISTFTFGEGDDACLELKFIKANYKAKEDLFNSGDLNYRLENSINNDISERVEKFHMLVSKMEKGLQNKYLDKIDSLEDQQFFENFLDKSDTIDLRESL